MLPDPTPTPTTTPPASPTSRAVGRLLVLPLAIPEADALRALLAHADAGRSQVGRAGADPAALSRSALMAERLEAALGSAPMLAPDPALTGWAIDALALPHAGVAIMGPGCGAAAHALSRTRRAVGSSPPAWVAASRAVAGRLARAVLHGEEAGAVALAQLALLIDEEIANA